MRKKKRDTLSVLEEQRGILIAVIKKRSRNCIRKSWKSRVRGINPPAVSRLSIGVDPSIKERVSSKSEGRRLREIARVISRWSQSLNPPLRKRIYYGDKSRWQGLTGPSDMKQALGIQCAISLRSYSSSTPSASGLSISRGASTYSALP